MRQIRTSPVIKRGIALTPVKFGISFTSTAYNQAGALVHIYNDGSVGLNHGGTEMGQGLYVKVAQVVAEEFQIDADRVRITATTTGKVPNTSATAASSGADLNGMAARAAAPDPEGPPASPSRRRPGASSPETVLFLPNRVRVGNQEIPWAELIHKAYLARVQLSATGFYKTPTIHWDRDAGRGHPFYYFAYGAACVQAAVDTLTGEYRIERVDILHDCGRSLNPADRQGPDRGRLHPGARLAHHRGTVVGRRGAPAHPRALHLQDPGLRRPSADLQRRPLRRTRTARRRSTARRRWASRR